MNVALWIVQGLLAAVFLASGSAKLTMSKERMIATGQTGVAPFPLPVIRVVALCEILGAIAVVLPEALGIASVLTPIAAAGFVGLMIGAALSHRSLHEYPQVVLNIGLLGLSIFVLIGRM